MLVKCVGTPLIFLLPYIGLYIKQILILYGILDVLYCDDLPLSPRGPENTPARVDYSDLIIYNLNDINPFNNYNYGSLDPGLLKDILNSGHNCMDILNSIEVSHLLNTRSVYVDLSYVNANRFPFDALEYNVLLCKGNPDVSLYGNLTILSLMLSNVNFEIDGIESIYLTLTHEGRAIFLLYSLGSMDSSFFPINLTMHKDLWVMNLGEKGIDVEPILKTRNSVNSISIAKDDVTTNGPLTSSVLYAMYTFMGRSDTLPVVVVRDTTIPEISGEVKSPRVGITCFYHRGKYFYIGENGR